MSLSAGDKLGPYEILSPLGAGGMGEVYKANDTRLHRTVAVKVLPDHIAGREDLRARFEREARAVASLKHPHICVLHDIGNQNGTGYMVMELVEGETLADRLEKGALPLEEALKCAGQIADALDRAHRAGVTHRDVKPQNIMLTRDGVKVLDFGLAKSSAKPAPSQATLTNAITAEGAVMGTPQYMAPEQFEGREADARCDIWAFGAVLYEMVSGRRAFQGKSYTSLVGAILATDPAPMSLQPFTPSWLERLVRRCLAKDPEHRYQSMRDVLLDLESPPPEIASAAAPASRWPWAAAAAGVLASAVLAGMLLIRSAPVASQPVEFEIQVPGGARSVTISPNGKWIAWRDDKTLSLWLRSLDSNNARMLDSGNPTHFSWSPDSKFLAYFTGRSLKRLEVATATTQMLRSELVVGRLGTAWTPDGYILVGANRGPIVKVRATGGPFSPALPLDEKAGERGQQYPLVLPGGEKVLYISLRSEQAASGIYLAALDGKSAAKLVRRGGDFAFVAPNTLLVSESGRLTALPFDPQSGDIGEPFTLSNGELLAAVSNSFAASSDGGVLASLSGSVNPEELTLYDRTGKKLESLPMAAPFPSAHLEFSPDGRRLVFERITGDDRDLWTIELERKVVSRLTMQEAAEAPGVWSADGQKVYFRTTRPGTGEGIYEISSNGTGSEKLVYKTNTHHMHASHDGKYLLFERLSNPRGLDYLDLQNGNKPSVYLNQDAESPQFSPDSRLVAYESSETGRSEVYVQTFPAGGGKWQISTNGGVEPRWRGDGKELYYDTGNGTIMAASLELKAGSVQVISTKELFKFQRGRTSGTAIAVTRDGKTFAIRETPATGASSILVKLNWKLQAN